MGNEPIDIDAYTIDTDTYTIELSDLTIGGYSADTIVIDEYDFYSDWANNIGRNNVVLSGGGEEMLRVAEDGFYVRGVKVPADAKEAEQVYNAFKQWLTWNTLSSN